MFKIPNFQCKTTTKKSAGKAGDSTNVESIRQIDLFLQNKANFTKCPNELNIS